MQEYGFDLNEPIGRNAESGPGLIGNLKKLKDDHKEKFLSNNNMHNIPRSKYLKQGGNIKSSINHSYF